MSTFFEQEYKCAVCGATNAYQVIGSTSSFGAPDLDLRPPMMQRNTIVAWVQVCPECGYVATEVSDPTKVTREWLQSKQYLTCDGIRFASGLAVNFYRQHLICLEDGDLETAFYALLHAAWACDDADDAANAQRMRKLAVPMAEKLLKDGDENQDNLLLMKADLMRRAGMFDELIKEYSSVRFMDKIMNQVLEFQIAKAKNKDVACYTVQNAVGE